jgi:hypothetical protein
LIVNWTLALLVGGLALGAGPVGATTPPPTEGDVANRPALEILAEVPVANEYDGGDYDRDLFSFGIDEDGDGCLTRPVVLVRESLVEPTVGTGCALVSGEWLVGVRRSDGHRPGRAGH